MTTACALMQQQHVNAIAAMFANAQVPPRFRHLTFKSYVEIAGAERGRKPALDAVREFYRFGAIQTESGNEVGYSVAMAQPTWAKQGCYARCSRISSP